MEEKEEQNKLVGYFIFLHSPYNHFNSVTYELCCSKTTRKEKPVLCQDKLTNKNKTSAKETTRPQKDSESNLLTAQVGIAKNFNEF